MTRPLAKAAPPTLRNVRNLSGKVTPWRETEFREIRAALSKAQGDKVIAAALLGIGKTAIYRKLQKFGLKESRSSG